MAIVMAIVMAKRITLIVIYNHMDVNTMDANNGATSVNK